MSETATTTADEAIVRDFLTALGNGQVLDALNAFSMDARMRDPNGHERHGIREIAAAFANQEQPVQVDIEELETEGETVAVRVRMTFPEAGEPRVYRSLFRVSRDRIRSFVINSLPARRTASQ